MLSEDLKKKQCVNVHGLCMILLVEEIIHAPNHRIHRVFHYEVLYIRGVCGCVFSSICIYCVCTKIYTPYIGSHQLAHSDTYVIPDFALRNYHAECLGNCLGVL